MAFPLPEAAIRASSLYQNSEEDTEIRINAYLALMKCPGGGVCPGAAYPGRESSPPRVSSCRWATGLAWVPPDGCGGFQSTLPPSLRCLPHPFCSPSFATPSGQITSHAPLTLVAIEQPRSSCFPLGPQFHLYNGVTVAELLSSFGQVMAYHLKERGEERLEARDSVCESQTP